MNAAPERVGAATSSAGTGSPRGQSFGFHRTSHAQGIQRALSAYYERTSPGLCYVTIIAALRFARRLSSCPCGNTTISALVLSHLRAGVVASPPPVFPRYGIATAAVLAVALLRYALFAEFAPWFLFTPAIVAVTLLLGGGAGMWATLLSTLCAGFVLLDVPPVGILSPTQWAASGIYAATTSGLVGMPPSTEPCRWLRVAWS